jgi:hypothetical protein
MYYPRKVLFPLLVLLTIATCVFISIIPDIYHLSITPPGVTFPLVHNAPEDYFYYLSLMHQGLEGRVTVVSRMSPEVFPAVLIQTIFPILGNISRITSISLIYMYFIARIVFGAALLLGSYLLISALFKKKIDRLTALMLVCFGTGFWQSITDNGTVQIIQSLTHWTRLDPVLRTTFLPHHMLSTVFGVFSIFFLSKALLTKKLWYVSIASIFGFLCGYTYFAIIINIIGGVCTASFLYFIFQKPWKNTLQVLKNQKTNFGILFIYVVSSMLSVLCILTVSKNVFPWSKYETGQKDYSFYIPFYAYLQSMGPTGLLSLIGIPIIITSGGYLTYLLLGWSLFPLIGIFLIGSMTKSYANVYYLEATSYIPLGILAVYGIKQIHKIVPFRALHYILLTVLVCYFIPPLKQSIETENVRLSPNRYNVYLPNPLIQGMQWLDAHSPKESVVLAGGYFGLIVPAYTHNTMVNGHPQKTYDPGVKSSDMMTFFSGKNINYAAQVLKKYHISYVFYAYDTDPPPQNYINELPWKKVFESDRVIIYKIN